MEPKECMLSKIKALDEAMSEIENKLKRIQETPKTNRFEPYVGTSEGLGPPSYMCNSWRNAQDASSYQQQFVGNREFNSGNRYQHDAYPSTYYKDGWENYLNSHDQSQWQGQPSWEQNQGESNLQYQNQWQGQPSWEQNQGESNLQYQNQWQGQPSWEQNQGESNLQYQSQWQGQPSWEQNQGESNLQYQNQWQGQPSWEQNQGESNLQYQSQWQGQPSWEQNQRETDFQYQRQWQGQPSWEQNQFLHREAGVTSSQPTWEQNLFSHREAGLTSSQPTLHDKTLAMIGDKAPKNDFYEPKTALYGSQAPTSLPEVIPPLKGQMDQLSNSFSLLDVDTNGDIEQTIMADTKAVKKKDIAFDPIVENELMKDSDMVSSNYRFPLVWIDLEMTGLDIETDRILEIACIITDGSLTKSIEGPDIVIHQKKECLDKMGEWCQKHHAASGLTEKVTRSLVTEREAEKQVIEFVKKYVGGTYYRPLLAGNSVYVDLLFLKKYMPELASLFGHVLVDVSSIKALCIRWFTRDHRNAPRKEKKHRAMDDIKESIAELKYYKDAIFKPSKF